MKGRIWKSFKQKVNSNQSFFGLTLQRFCRHKAAITGLYIVIFFAGMALGAPFLAPYDPLLLHKGEEFLPPSTKYLFGTDEFGRDILSRVIFASRISLGLGAISVILATLIGVPVGLIAGFFGNWVDTVIMRTLDCLLAFPPVLLAMAVVAVLGPSSTNVMIAVAIASIPTFSRLARASVLAQKGLDYVEAARAMGAKTQRIVFRTIFPNSLPPILVQMSLSLGYAMLLEAALSFLGLGTQPPDASWGAMLNIARGYLRQAPWYAISPGIAITVLILALNTVTDGLRDALNPAKQL